MLYDTRFPLTNQPIHACVFAFYATPPNTKQIFFFLFFFFFFGQTEPPNTNVPVALRLNFLRGFASLGFALFLDLAAKSATTQARVVF